MLNLPVPPQTRITRQLTCVSCQEQFTISEDDPVRPYRIGDNWQSPISNTSDFPLHYQEDRTRRSVLPDNHANPQRSAHHTWSPQRRENICCPRCGTDNRNWLNLLHPGGSTKWFRPWRQRFPSAVKGIAVSSLFVILAGIYAYQLKMPFPRALILIVFIFLGALLPALELTQPSHWRGLRENWHLQRICQEDRSNRETGLWVRGFLFFLIASFFVPVILFLYGPRAAIFFNQVFNPEPATIVENVAAPYISRLNEQLNEMPQDVAHLTHDTIKRLEDIPYPWAYSSAIESILDEFNQDLAEMLEDLADTTQPDTLTQVTALQAIVKEAMSEVERVQNEDAQEAIKEAGSTIRFLAFWGMLVGSSSLISMFASMHAVKGFTRKIDRQLPPPIFNSVANMTRVVVWEAKKALEIGDEVEHVQWTAVNRNSHGGINLQGLYYDNSLPRTNSDPLTARILAHRYEIISDRWGRIVKANIKPARVSQRPQRPRSREVALGDELFGSLQNQPARSERPSSPPRQS